MLNFLLDEIIKKPMLMRLIGPSLLRSSPYLNRPTIPFGSQFLVVGAPRSGTTSTIKILGAAKNIHITHEVKPRMASNIRLYEHSEALTPPQNIIWNYRCEHLMKALQKGVIWGDKDQQMYPWLPYYRDVFNSKFVFVQRDGRDVVRSMMDYHYNVVGHMYLEKKDNDLLHPESRIRLDSLDPKRLSEIDFSRSRPAPGERYYDDWHDFSRLQMFAWLWSNANLVALRDLHRFNNEIWTRINYSGNDLVNRFESVYKFLCLKGFSSLKIKKILNEKINNINDKFKGAIKRYSSWDGWSEKERSNFDLIARPAMVELGYYELSEIDYYNSYAKYLDFYLHQNSDPCSSEIFNLIMDYKIADKKVTDVVLQASNILILGDGDIKYTTGNNKVIKWREGKLGEIPTDSFDLIISQGIIDRVPDIDRHLHEMDKRLKQNGTLIIIGSIGDSSKITHHNHKEFKGKYKNSWCTSRTQSLLEMQYKYKKTCFHSVRISDNLRVKVPAIIGVK